MTEETVEGRVAADFRFIHLMPTKKLYRKPKDPVQRFLSKTRAGPDGCIEWSGHKTRPGYGQFSWMSKPILAHRWVYEAVKGPIPKGMVIDHLCRNRACVNVAHLECVSMGENTKRGLLHIMQKAKAAGTTHCQRGHPLFGPNLIITSSGHRSCKKCQRSAATLWKIANRDRVNACQRARRAKGKK